MSYKPGDWYCPQCRGLIFASKKMCLKCKVDRNGQKQNLKKIGDWICKACGDYQFARNSKCRKCNAPKTGHSAPQINKKPGDWNCPKCDDHNFAKNMACRKCYTPNPNMTYTPPKTTPVKSTDDENDKLCSICLDEPKVMLLLHQNGSEGHLCCCESCAEQLIDLNHDCPICRTPVTQAIKVF